MAATKCLPLKVDRFWVDDDQKLSNSFLDLINHSNGFFSQALNVISHPPDMNDSKSIPGWSYNGVAIFDVVLSKSTWDSDGVSRGDDKDILWVGTIQLRRVAFAD
nr:hypothetical protein [Tanacetum cinerariifolium]